MAEFVELNLEKLLPVFERLKKHELMSTPEVTEFIKRCRHYEYKTSKLTKRPIDFISYAEYLNEMIRLIQKRRKSLRIFGNNTLIEFPLKHKCAFLYRICTERFKKIEYFRREIQYLKKENLRTLCSAAYTRLIRFHGRDPNNHVEAAHFEFFKNHSAENARTILQIALRIFPNNIQLWAKFFEVEISFVKFLKKRRDFLLKQANKDPKENLKNAEGSNREPENLAEKKIDDEIMNLKLAEIVYEQAIKAIPENEHSKLIGAFLDICRKVEDNSLDKLVEKLQNAYDNAPQQEIDIDEICEFLPDASTEPTNNRNEHTVSDNNFKSISLNSEEFCKLNPIEKKSAFENALIEFGTNNLECWIEYLKFLLETDPLSIGLLNKRALINLDKNLLEDFEVEWTKVIMNASC